MHLEVKDHEGKEEKPVKSVRWANVERWVCPVRWALQDHRALVGSPSLARLVVQVLRGIQAMLAYLDRKVHRDRLVPSGLLDQLEYGDPQGRRDLQDPWAHKDQWDPQEPLECRDLLESLERMEIQVFRDLLGLKETKETEETSHPRA